MVELERGSEMGASACNRAFEAHLFSTSLPELSRLIRNNGAHSLQNPFGIRLGNIGNLGPTFIVNLFVPRLFYQRFLDLVWHTNSFSQAIAIYPTRSHQRSELDAFTFSKITKSHRHYLPCLSSLAFAAPLSCLPPCSRHQR